MTGETQSVAWIRGAALYLPLMAATLSGLLTRRRPRQFASLLLSFLWAAVTLLALQRFNLRAGWWTYPDPGVAICGMPLELYIGWVILWGLFPQIALSRIVIGWAAAVLAIADLILMPMCAAVVRLQPSWFIGESAAVCFVLLPALCIARWTERDTHLYLRTAMQVVTAGLLFLFLIPETVFALRPGYGWSPLSQLAGWERQAILQAIFVLALPGVAAVMEFAQRGGGTPIPYDPPKRLVTSGIYRYCANPMQLSCTLVMLCWACLLRNGWMVGAAAMSAIYSAGIAEWDERHDLHNRFGDAWRRYRTTVRNWIPRWRPYHAGATATLYIATSCGLCTELRGWLEARAPLGIEILEAETLPQGSIRRMRYDPGDGCANVDGVRALGRALEHLNLGWALAGAALRLPIVWQGIQLVMDASGLGPRNVAARPRTRKDPAADELSSEISSNHPRLPAGE